MSASEQSGDRTWLQKRMEEISQSSGIPTPEPDMLNMHTGIERWDVQALRRQVAKASSYMGYLEWAVRRKESEAYWLKRRAQEYMDGRLPNMKGATVKEREAFVREADSEYQDMAREHQEAELELAELRGLRDGWKAVYDGVSRLISLYSTEMELMGRDVRE